MVSDWTTPFSAALFGMLLEHPELSPVRATDDVDVVIEVVSRRAT